MIKNLVFSGGGPVVFMQFGIIKYLKKINYIKYENIKSIYSTSVGSVAGLFFILNIYDDWVEDYIILRPWEKIFKLKNYQYFKILLNKGIYDIEEIVKILFKPIFKLKNIDIDINLHDFYNITKIDFHIFVTKVNDCEKIDLNYRTFPDITLLKAISMSCCIPFIFTPIYYKDEFYIDGGFLANCPLNESCINGNNEDETLCIINDLKYNFIYDNGIVLDSSYNNIMYKNNFKIKENISTLYFLYFIIFNFLNKFFLDQCNNITTIKNAICCSINNNDNTFNYWLSSVTNKNIRIDLINIGITRANNYIKKRYYDLSYNTDVCCNEIFYFDISECLIYNDVSNNN